MSDANERVKELLEERDELRACLYVARGYVQLQWARNPVPYNFETLQRIDRVLTPIQDPERTDAPRES